MRGGAGSLNVSRCADLSRSAQGYFTQMTIMLFGQDQRESSELMKRTRDRQ
jgi:hypothetical protein